MSIIQPDLSGQHGKLQAVKYLLTCTLELAEPIYLAAIAFCSSMFTACAGLVGGFYYSH